MRMPKRKRAIRRLSRKLKQPVRSRLVLLNYDAPNLTASQTSIYVSNVRPHHDTPHLSFAILLIFPFSERNGRKTLTTIEGIPSKFDLKKILKVIKKKFACNGTIVNDEKAGDVIQLQGDQRIAIKEFLVDKDDGLDIDGKIIKVRPISLWTLREMI